MQNCFFFSLYYGKKNYGVKLVLRKKKTMFLDIRTWLVRSKLKTQPGSRDPGLDLSLSLSVSSSLDRPHPLCVFSLASRAAIIFLSFSLERERETVNTHTKHTDSTTRNKQQCKDAKQLFVNVFTLSFLIHTCENNEPIEMVFY